MTFSNNYIGIICKEHKWVLGTSSGTLFIYIKNWSQNWYLCYSIRYFKPIKRWYICVFSHHTSLISNWPISNSHFIHFVIRSWWSMQWNMLWIGNRTLRQLNVTYPKTPTFILVDLIKNTYKLTYFTLIEFITYVREQNYERIMIWQS